MNTKILNGVPHMRVAEDLWRPVPAGEVARFELLHTLERNVKNHAAFAASGVANYPPPSERVIRSLRVPSALVGGVSRHQRIR